VGSISAHVTDDENGYLVESHDYEGAARGVMNLLSGGNLREKMGTPACEGKLSDHTSD